MYPSLPKKIQIAIDKFAARINFENKEIRKIKSMNNERPDYTKFDLEEETEIERAWETIGDFNLKSASDFKLSDEQVVSMEDKFDQYTNVQDEVKFSCFCFYHYRFSKYIMFYNLFVYIRYII